MTDRRKLEELQSAKRRIEAEIDEECRRLVREGHERSVAASAGTKWAQMSDAQRQHCCFLGIDPDDPDGIPLD